LILENLDKNSILEKANKLGGTIKIIEIDNSKNILDIGLTNEGKFQY